MQKEEEQARLPRSLELISSRTFLLPSLSAASAHGLKILFQHHLVHVTPAPVLARLDRLHDGMMRSMKMLCRMLILRRITTAYVTATEAQSEMDPGVAHFQTFLTSLAARMHIPNFFDVCAAVSSHSILLVSRRYCRSPGTMNSILIAHQFDLYHSRQVSVSHSNVLKM